MRVILLGGLWDGEVVELDVEIAPPTILRQTYGSKQIAELAARDPHWEAPTVRYRKSQHPRPDGSVFYVLEGANL